MDNAAKRIDIRTNIRLCRACDLRAGCTAPVPFEGPTPAILTVIGEAPGESEDQQGKPFVGKSGEALNRWLKEYLNLPRSQVFVMNTVNCRPPSNRQPSPLELASCSNHLEAQLNLADSPFVLLLGRTAISQFNLNLRVTRDHGKPFTLNSRIFYPTYHPAAVLRNSHLEGTVAADLIPLAAELVQYAVASQSKVSSVPVTP